MSTQTSTHLSYGSSSQTSLSPGGFESFSLTMQHLFRQIPPERIGLTGEYDHNGLSKRVQAALDRAFKPEVLQNLKVRQRGAMVVLLGTVPDRNLLSSIVKVAMTVEGAIGVEVNGVNVVSPAFKAALFLRGTSAFPASASQTVG